jgi:hypothetical protein
MLTWLDHYVRDAARHFKANGARLYPELKQRYPWADNDVGITGLLSYHTFMGISPLTGLPVPSLENRRIDTHKMGLTLATIPFCVPRSMLADLCLKPPRAIQPSARLLEDFKGARPPKSTEHIELLHTYSWYIDIPHGSLMNGDKEEVRCLFVIPLSRKTQVVAVSTRLNSDEMAAVGTGAPFEQDAHSRRDNAAASLTSEALENVSELVTMLLLYYLHPHPQTTAELPYADPQQVASMKSNKAKTKLQFASMFRIVRLDSPPDRFGRTSQRRAGPSWNLNWRVQVDGYYRWQPWGPSSSLRRWQYVKGYERGPVDAPSKTDLTKLDC